MQVVSDGRSGPAQVLLDGAFGAAEDYGDVGDREVVDEPERGGLRLAPGQAADGCPQLLGVVGKGLGLATAGQPGKGPDLDHPAAEGGDGQVGADPADPQVGTVEVGDGAPLPVGHEHRL